MNNKQLLNSINYNYIRRWYNCITISNVPAFNKYIFDKIRKIKNIPDTDLLDYFGEIEFPDTILSYVSMFYKNIKSMEPKWSNFNQTINNTYYMDFINEKSNDSLMSNVCILYLIGTPEDVEDLSMLPGLIVREVYDETCFFLKDTIATSILNAQTQLIEYKLDSYYDVLPDWWTNVNRRRLEDEDPVELYDQPYSECTDFVNPRNFETITQYCQHQINPDERVYRIYIQMSDDLVATAYERSNFFISIRNSKEKMSIKNFLKYLS